MRNVAIVIACLLFAVAARVARADDAETESRIRQQDELNTEAGRDKLLASAQSAVSDSDSAMNRYLLGRAYGLLGEFEKAKEQFDWAIERDPSYAYSYHGLGVYQMVKQNPDEAERQFRTALRLDDHLTRAHADLGRLYLSKNDRLQAEHEFQEVLKYDPQNTDVRTLLAFEYLKEKRYDRAVQEFQVILAKVPDNIPARKGYALALGFDRHTDEAIAEFKKYIGMQPKDFEAYVFLEKFCLQKGDVPGAIAALDQLLDVAPKDSSWRKEAEGERKRLKEGGASAPKVKSYDDLLKLLDSDDVSVRRRAMRTLCSLDYYRLPRRMVQAVTDPDLVVRTLVVKKLGEVSHAQALPLLEILLRHEKDRDAAKEVRAAAARGIADSDSAAALPILVAALSDDSQYVFKTVVAGLRRASGLYFTDDPTAPPPPSKKSEIAASWRAWWAGPRAFSLKLDAIDALVRLDFARGRIYLADLIGDADPAVAAAALAGFVKVTGQVPGKKDDLDTPEGRAAVRDRARKIITGK